jgi:predicted ATPase
MCVAELPNKMSIFLVADVPPGIGATEGDVALRFETALRAAAEAHGGVVREADSSLFVLFDTAGAALAAALDVVGRLQYSAGTALPRLALYSGKESLQGASTSSALGRARVLLQAAHAGQVLVSTTTRGLIGNDLPAGLTVRDLGEHRLRDLHQPEHIFQVVAPNLPGDFPALNTLDRFRHNLPTQATPLVGRADELAAVCEQIVRGARVVTLTGPGGTGKTRLAFEGVFFVALAPVSDAGLVGATIAQTLGVREAGGQPLMAALQGHLRDKRLLLLLDNFEQVRAAAPLISDLLHDAPDLMVLVTSREQLDLPEEYVFDVPPLAVPDPKALPGSGLAAALGRYEAVRLFVERATSVDPSFVLTDANSSAVAQICYRLDGLPLAIELAAARVHLLPPAALLARLDRGLHVLSGSAFNLPLRQQTLRGTIGMSYDLLSSEEQQLFRRLGVFAGGCTPEAVAAVCGESIDALIALTHKSLLRREQRAAARFFMLDTIRQYALERLRESDEAEQIRLQYATFFLALSEQAEPELTGPRQQQWLEQLAAEHNNLRAVLTWTLERNQVEMAVRLAKALWRFWHTRGYLSEGRIWLQSALSKASAVQPDLRAQALFAAAALAWAQGAYSDAQGYADESLTLRRELGDTRGIAASLNVLGLLAQEMGDHRAARMFFEESNALCRDLDDTRGIGVTLLNLGETARALGEFSTARALIEESLHALRAVGDTRYIASALDYLGNVVYEQQDYAAAHRLLAESLALRWMLRDMSGIARTLSGLASVICSFGHDPSFALRAAHLYGAADAVRTAIGAPVPAADRPRYESDLERVRSYLDAAAFEMAWGEGRAMKLEQAIAEAQQTPAGLR